MQEVTIKKDSSIKLEERMFEFLNPKFIFLPVKDGFKLKVRDNEYVYKNDIVAMDTHGHSIHSSVSGRVLGIKVMPFYKEGMISSLVIENDFKENIKVRKSAKKYITNYTKKELMSILNDTSLKYKGKYVQEKLQDTEKTILINGVENEPYFDNKIFAFRDNLDELLETIDLLGMCMKSPEIILVVKNNEEKLINDLVSLLGTYPNIKLKLVNDAYPNGMDEVLKKKLSFEDSVIFDIVEIALIYETIKRENPVAEKLLTITGNAVEPKGVVKVKIGSLLSEVFVTKFNFTEEQVDVYMNGMMSGELVSSLKVVVDTNVDGVLVMKRNDKTEVERCIKCGLCSKNCPMGCNPKYVYDHEGRVKREYYEKCIGCGLCNYLCPANIDLKKLMMECDKR